MGLLCTKFASSSVEERNTGGATTDPADSSTNRKNAKSLDHFDGQEKSLKKELESIRENFRGTVYFDALEDIEIEDEGDFKMKDDQPFRYAPATSANPHPRASLAFDQSATLLKKKPDKKQMAASAAIMQELKRPSSQGVCLEGYPGELTAEELEACKLFRRRLKDKDPAYYGMVLALSPMEEEPYAICRFMRARNFQVDATIEMMDECIDLWKDAAKNNFYPTIEQAIGRDAAVFFTQFPGVRQGLAKNGTVPVYLQIGSMSVEGLECLVEIDVLCCYWWYTMKHNFTKQLTSLQEANPQVVVRAEEMYVVDMKNMTSSQLSKAAIDAIKKMCAPSACFPEILNKTVVVNAPGFFSFIWRMVKVFLHPRTARKVEIYSDADKGNRRVKELIDTENVPSDYGGQGFSFDEIAQQQYCGEGRRQVHQLLKTSKNKKAEWNFTLNAKEHASVTVYTRSSAGADFTISSENKKVAQCSVERSGKSGSYSKEIVSKIEGAGPFHVKGQPNSKGPDYFLVIVSISM